MSSNSAFRTGLLIGTAAGAGLLIGTAAGGIAAALVLGLLPIAASRTKAENNTDAEQKDAEQDAEQKDAEQKGGQRRHVIRVTWFHEDFAVCKLAGGPADAYVVGWRIVEKSLSAISAGTGEHPVFAALTSGEYSVVVPTPWVGDVTSACCVPIGPVPSGPVPKGGADREKVWKVDGGWRCFVVDNTRRVARL